MKSAAPRLSLEAALYNAVSPTHSTTNDVVPPAPWWWPAPQFDAPEVVDPPQKEADNVPVPDHDVQPELGSPPGLEASAAKEKLSAPPGLEETFDVPKSDIPQGVSAPPCFDATSIELVTSTNAENDEVPPPPTWSADVPANSLLSPATGSVNAPPTWWPASPTEVVEVDETPPPPTWSPGEAKEASSDEEDMVAESENSHPPSPSYLPPPPPADAQVSDSTPPPPSYDAPGFETESPPPSLPPNVAAPPTEPPKLVVSLEALTDAKAPPSAPPKDLPKLKVSLDDLTDAKPAPGGVPSMAPPAYMAPGFGLPYFNVMSPSYMHSSGYPTPYSPMGGSYPSPAGVPSNWERF